MRQIFEERRWVGSQRQEVRTSGVSRIDREALEGVMREDVFRAADGRALAFDFSQEPPRPRMDLRRA
jgi:hypothetical protein